MEEVIRQVPQLRVATRETTGQRIRRLRLAKGLSQEQLAVYAGMSRQTVVAAEREQHTRLDNIESLAATLGVSREYLITGIDPDREGGWESPEVALRATTNLSEQDIQTLLRLISAMEKEADAQDTA